MATVLKITDGTTTIDFLDNVTGSYRITAWTPAVAKPRANSLGGRGPFEDVAESMTLSVRGTGYHAAENLGFIQKLLEQAVRWSQGDPVAPVLIHYKATASSEELKTVITGAAGNKPLVELPPGFLRNPLVNIIDGVKINFTRLGLWYGPETSTNSGSTATAPNPRTVGIADLSTLGWPVKVRMEGISRTDTLWNNYIAISTTNTGDVSDARIKVLAAINLERTLGGFTVISDSGQRPLNDSTVLRYTPTGTTPDYTATYSTSYISQSVRRWGVFVTCRNNHATTTFTVTCYIHGKGVDVTTTRPYTVPGYNVLQNENVHYLGTATIASGFDAVHLVVEASAAAGTLDIDALVFVAMDDDKTSRVIKINEMGSYIIATNDDLIIDHRLLEKPTPAVYMDETNDIIIPYIGDAAVHLKGQIAYCAFIATGKGTYSGWTPHAFLAKNELKWYFTTRTAYLFPV